MKPVCTRCGFQHQETTKYCWICRAKEKERRDREKRGIRLRSPRQAQVIPEGYKKCRRCKGPHQEKTKTCKPCLDKARARWKVWINQPGIRAHHNMLNERWRKAHPDKIKEYRKKRDQKSEYRRQAEYQKEYNLTFTMNRTLNRLVKLLLMEASNDTSREVSQDQGYTVQDGTYGDQESLHRS